VSLDHIKAQHMIPMNDLVADMVSHRKYKGIPRDRVETELKTEFQRRSDYLHYTFFPDPNRPGTFSVMHIMLNTKTKRGHLSKEVIEVTPDGFVYRGQQLKTPDEVANYLKAHKNDNAAASKSSVPWSRTNAQQSGPPAAQTTGRQSRGGPSGGGGGGGGGGGNGSGYYR